MNRRRSTQCQHNRTQRCQLIVKSTSFVDITTLESKLKAATTHPETHCVHMNMIGFLRSASCHGYLRVFVLEYWNSICISVNPCETKLVTFIYLPGISIDTFDPRRILIFLDNVLNRGCPGKMASSTKYKDLATPSSASGLGAYEGNVKLGLHV